MGTCSGNLYPSVDMATLFTTKKRRADQVLWSKLDQHLMRFCDQGIVLAISGGPDSRALLEAVATWPNRARCRFVVTAIDHGMRREAEGEARFIALRAQRLGFDAHCERLGDTGLFGEQDLRRARYRQLRRIAELYSCRAICTAHHSDDNSEGYFMALMGVGGGELGAAMSEIEASDGFFLCRPFLALTKKDLLLTLSLAGITDFVRDSLDEARSGERAYVRYDVFPELTRLAPGVKARLATFSRAQRLQRTAVDKMASSLIVWHDDRAVLRWETAPDQALIVSALWQILKKWSNGKDLRACQPVIESIANSFAKSGDDKELDAAGLDPTLNGFNLKDLSTKEYQFPGAVLLKSPSDIVVRRL